MGDRLRASVPPRYVTKPTRSTQPCIPPGSLNRVPALIGWGKGGNVTSAGWQVTLCDPIWHMSSCSGEAVCELLYFLPFTFTFNWSECNDDVITMGVDRSSELNGLTPLRIVQVGRQFRQFGMYVLDGAISCLQVRQLCAYM